MNNLSSLASVVRWTFTCEQQKPIPSLLLKYYKKSTAAHGADIMKLEEGERSVLVRFQKL
jgi:hypothetical protein